MKAFLISAFLLATIPTAYADDDEDFLASFAGHAAFETLNLVANKMDRDTRVLAASHLPGAMPLPFVCKNADPKSGDSTILPGDEVRTEATAQAYRCSNGLRFLLHPKSVIRFSEYKPNFTAVTIEEGAMEGLPGKSALYVRSNHYEVELQFPSGSGQFSLTRKNETTQLICQHGEAEGSIAKITKKANERFFIGSFNCQITLSHVRKPNAQIFLYKNDSSHVLDARLPRVYWRDPTVPSLQDSFVSLWDPTRNAISIDLSPTPDRDGNHAIHWTSSVPQLKHCTLYGHARENAARVAIYNFKPEPSNRIISLQPTHAKLWLALKCASSDGKDLASNLLAPRK